MIAEDSVLLREGLSRLLEESGIDVVGSCSTVDELLLEVSSYSPDVAIVDIRLPQPTTMKGSWELWRFVLGTQRLACWCSLSTSSSGSR